MHRKMDDALRMNDEMYAVEPLCRRPLSLVISVLVIVYLAALAAGCVASSHPTAPSQFGRVASGDEMLAVLAEPGPVRFETVVAADWKVPLSGLLNLDHPRAIEAGLQDRTESIEIYFHVLDHPRFGVFLVDSGLAEEFLEPDTNPHLSMIVKTAMNTDALTVRTTTANWMREKSVKPAGVFLTHIHLDHIMGLPDLALDTPVYTGPAETEARKLLNMFSRGTTDRLIGDLGALNEWQFASDPSGLFTAVIDVFGDGSVWALHVPGHSPGSTAFAVRTTEGPVLLTGDASHTAWGWHYGVEPGTFSDDKPRSAQSLAQLRALLARIPQLDVRLGHQPLGVSPAHTAAVGPRESPAELASK